VGAYSNSCFTGVLKIKLRREPEEEGLADLFITKRIRRVGRDGGGKVLSRSFLLPRRGRGGRGKGTADKEGISLSIVSFHIFLGGGEEGGKTLLPKKHPI